MAYSSKELEDAREHAVQFLVKFTNPDMGRRTAEYASADARRAEAMLGVIDFLDREIPKVEGDEVRYGNQPTSLTK